MSNLTKDQKDELVTSYAALALYDGDSEMRTWMTMEETKGLEISVRDGAPKSAAEVLSLKDITLGEMEALMMKVVPSMPADEDQGEGVRQIFPTPDAAKDTVEAACKYRFYLERQEKEMDSWRRNAALRIPMDITYSRENFPSLSAEEIQKLAAHRPVTFHAASQISGITPHSLVYLFNYVTKKGKAEIVTHHWQELEEQETEKGLMQEDRQQQQQQQQEAAKANAGSG